MKNTAIGVLIGAAIGSLITWKITKKKYQAIADEEIRSVKEVYAKDKAKKEEKPVEEKEEPKIVKQAYVPTREDKETSEHMAMEYRTGSFAEKGEQTGHPYTITSNDFANTNEYYDKISLNLLADGKIEDEDGNPWDIEEIENSIGLKNLDSIGEFEPGVLYVRNDILQTDYEVIEDKPV